MPHLKQGLNAWFPWLGAFCNDGAAGRNDCGGFWCCMVAHSTSLAIVAITA
jgi:hypothetical protein